MASETEEPGLAPLEASLTTRKNCVWVEFDASRTKGAEGTFAYLASVVLLLVLLEADVALKDVEDMTREARRCFKVTPTFLKHSKRR